MTFQGVKQGGCKAEVALHELLLSFRTIDTSEVEHKVGIGAIAVKQSRICVDVVLKNFIDCESGACAVFALFDVTQGSAEVSAYKSFGTSDKNIHNMGASTNYLN